MNISDLKLKAKEVLSKNTFLYMYTIIYLAVCVALSVCSQFIPIVGFCMYFLGITVLYAIQYRIALDVSSEKNIDFNAGVNKFLNVLKVIGVMFLYLLPALIALIGISVGFSLFSYTTITTQVEVNTILMENRNLIGGISGIIMLIVILAFTVWSFYLSLTYGLSYFVAVDDDYKDLGAFELMKETKNIIKGHRFDYFVLELSFIGWFLLSGITCGLASIYVVPYQMLTLAQFYKTLKPTKENKYTDYMY